MPWRSLRVLLHYGFDESGGALRTECRCAQSVERPRVLPDMVLALQVDGIRDAAPVHHGRNRWRREDEQGEGARDWIGPRVERENVESLARQLYRVEHSCQLVPHQLPVADVVAHGTLVHDEAAVGGILPRQHL